MKRVLRIPYQECAAHVYPLGSGQPETLFTKAGTGNVLLIPTHIVQSLWARLNIRGRRTALTTRAHEYFEKATLELSNRDLEHAAHRLGGTPQ